MGIAASRQFATDVINDADQGISLESVLNGSKEFSRWKICYKQLTPQSKKGIQKIVASKARENCLSKAEQVKTSDIDISRPFQPYFESWKRLGETFFVDNTATQDIAPKVYLELRRIMQRHIDDPVRARLFAVALYDLRLQLSEDMARRPRSEVKTTIEQVIFQSRVMDEPMEEVVKYTKSFLKFGERMRTIVERNGGIGASMVIPSSLLSFRQWQRLTNDEFQSIIRHLQTIGVQEATRKCGAQKVADDIYDCILQRFTSKAAEEQALHGDNVEDSNMEDSDDDEMSDTGNESSVANQSMSSDTTSVGPNLDSLQNLLHQEHLSPVDSKFGQQMKKPGYHTPLASTLALTNETIDNSALESLSEAPNLACYQIEEQAQEFNLISATPCAHEIPAAFPGQHPQLCDGESYRRFRDPYYCFNNDSNPTSTNSDHGPSPGASNDPALIESGRRTDYNSTSDNALANSTEEIYWPCNEIPVNLASYAADATLPTTNRVGHGNTLDDYYYTPDTTLANPAEINYEYILDDHYNDPGATLANHIGVNYGDPLDGYYQDPDTTLVNPTEANHWTDSNTLINPTGNISWAHRQSISNWTVSPPIHEEGPSSVPMDEV